jgi:hypothetical protein
MDQLIYIMTHLSEPWVGVPLALGSSVTALIGIYWIAK